MRRLDIVANSLHRYLQQTLLLHGNYEVPKYIDAHRGFDQQWQKIEHSRYQQLNGYQLKQIL